MQLPELPPLIKSEKYTLYFVALKIITEASWRKYLVCSVSLVSVGLSLRSVYACHS